MDDENKLRDDLELWATNSEEGGWNIASTDEGSQKMLEDESEKQIKIQTGSDVVDDYFYMPIRSTVEYYVKDARLSKWINKDIGTIMGNNHNMNIESDMVKGLISVNYAKYRVNRGIKDSIFED